MSNIIENGNYCVYIHTSPSGKKYVGQTGKKPEERWGKNGSRYLNKINGKYNHPAFARAILKYGWENFEHEIIASNLTKSEADNFEKLLIEKLNTMSANGGYNCKEGGTGGSFSEETLRKMSESHKGVKQSEETKRKRFEKISGENNYNYGKHLPEETRKKISETLKGNTISESTRKKLSDSMKGKYLGANSSCAKKIVQYDMQGNFIKIWDSISDAARALNLSIASIARCCNNIDGHWKTAGGYIWRFLDNELTKEYIDICNKYKGSKRIAQCSLSNEIICVYEDMTEVELKTGINHSNVSACCNGRRKTAGGFIWKYYEDVEKEVI